MDDGWGQSGLSRVARQLKRRTTLERSRDKFNPNQTHMLATPPEASDSGATDLDTLPSPSTSSPPSMTHAVRVRRHLFKEVVVNGYQKCKGCPKKIGYANPYPIYNCGLLPLSLG